MSDSEESEFTTHVEVNGKKVENSDWSDSEDDLVGYSYAPLDSQEPNEFDDEEIQEANYVSVSVTEDAENLELNYEEELQLQTNVVQETMKTIIHKDEHEFRSEREVKVLYNRFDAPPVSEDVKKERVRTAMKEFDEKYAQEISTSNPPPQQDKPVSSNNLSAIADAMKGFKLDYVPPWAQNMTDDTWNDLVKKAKDK